MSGKKAIEKAPQAKGTEAEDIIEEYLREQYRPFAVNDIVQNLHNKLTKTQAVKALESLVKQERITCKLFGKIAIYVCNEQELRPESPGDHAAEDTSLEALIQLREELVQIEKDRNESSSHLQNILKRPTNEELTELLEVRTREIAQIEEHLQEVVDGWRPENDRIISIIRENERKIQKEIASRKRILDSAVSLVKEALAIKNIDELLEGLGIEKVD
ncbi:LADA_0H11628g1_1 [Lachancea dasiensis]|uniref:LADA_0H11628g1_1 n=1 Tax=Lachancea dasiensis TaxID=1072105 RepID=A0A1G4K3V7_9SACH|nr:LADA_0H11628g1_1 [Lachancea dasiensis]